MEVDLFAHGVLRVSIDFRDGVFDIDMGMKDNEELVFLVGVWHMVMKKEG